MLIDPSNVVSFGKEKETLFNKWRLMSYICFNELRHHWLKQWLIAHSVPSYFRDLLSENLQHLQGLSVVLSVTDKTMLTYHQTHPLKAFSVFRNALHFNSIVAIVLQMVFADVWQLYMQSVRTSPHPWVRRCPYSIYVQGHHNSSNF